MNVDALNHAPVLDTCRGAMAVINAIQDLPQGVQEAAITAAFVLMCEVKGLRPTDLFTVSGNIINHAEGKRPEFAAVSQYIREELS